MIPKRVFWFGLGAASGFGGAIYTYARVREARGRLAADRVAGQVADTVVGTARNVRDTMRDAVTEGRDAMVEADLRIKADLDERR